MTIDTSVSLQHKLQLEACGMQDNPRGGPNLAERLERLKAYDVAWRNLDWTGHDNYPSFSGSFTPIAVSQDVVAFPVDNPQVVFKQFPSQLRGIEGQEWSIPLKDVIDIGVDASQDLVVFVTQSLSDVRWCHILLRSLATGEAHPLACAQDRIIKLGYARQGVDIYGDFLCVRLDGDLNDPLPHTANISVWNWKIGTIQLDMSSLFYTTAMPNPRFLDAKHIVTIVPSADGDGPLRLVVLSFRSKLQTPPAYIFILPDFLTLDFLGNLSMTSSPPSGHPSGDLASGCVYHNPEDRLLSITFGLRFAFASPAATEIVIDVPTRTLLSYMQNNPVGTVPWMHWGPSGSRISVAPMGISAHCTPYSINGMRRVQLSPTLRNGSPVITVYDYHPRRVARAIASQGTGEYVREVVGYGDVVDESLTAGHGALKTLPYLVKEIPLQDGQLLQYPFDNIWNIEVVISEDGVILMDVSLVRS
ncbi:hypothetical protein BV25DRAFT_1915142 [Artomyces pyxidatus]|uniref:Uncharacterized protein n=1 Tax=Artomyces pyxidatus TaxID=48021 RepID=A0ACB8T6P8_9AGAM|nr:hypothetical protein BV25DRAFT_1915142 [Artomyces pyxidatus]